MKFNTQHTEKSQHHGFSLVIVLGLALLLVGGIATTLRAQAQGAGPAAPSSPQADLLSTVFTYQGRLMEDETAVDGVTCTFTFELYEVASGGAPLDTYSENVAVDDGYFSVALDFGSDAFQGDARWLAISVQCPGDSAPVPLSDQRAALTAAPYALYALGAPWTGLSDVPPDLEDGDDDTLGSLMCNDGQIAEWDDATSQWACGDDDGGSGDITAVYAGAGLSGGGSSGDLTLTAAFSGTGSADSVARSDHDHWGQTWSGTGQGLVITGTADGEPLLIVTNNGAYNAAGLSALAGGYGAGASGYNYNGTGAGVYGCSSSNTCAVHTGNIGVEGFSGDDGGYGVYGIGDHAVVGLSDAASGAGGRFVNAYSGSYTTTTTGLWVGANQGDLIQGHQVNWMGNPIGLPFRVDYTGTVHATGGYFTHTQGHALVVDGPTLDYGLTPRQIATLRWYDAISSQMPYAISVGNDPRQAAFDGDHVWVTNAVDHSVTKIRASDGVVIGTYALGTSCGPDGIAFDGLYLWIGCWQDQVVKMQASDGSVVQTLNFPAGSQPMAVAFDGTYAWAARQGDGRVTRMLSANPIVSDTVTVGQNPAGLAFDGRYVWVTNFGDGNVTRLLSVNPAISETFSTGIGPSGIAFDGATMWVANRAGDTVTGLSATDGTQLYTVTVGNSPTGVAFDGGHIWVTNYSDATVTKIRAWDGRVIGTYPTGGYPQGVVFDGSHVWVVNSDNDTVSKH